MAKKRKLRQSESAPASTSEAGEQPSQFEVTEGQDLQKLEQPQNMDQDESQLEEPGKDHQEEGEEDEEQDEEEEQNPTETLTASSGGIPAVTLAAEANGGAANNAADDEDDDEEEEDVEEEPVEKLLEPFSKDQLICLLKEAVEKCPELVNSVRRLADADPAHRKIFVHGLGWDTTSETLISVFGKYGEIEDCKAVTDKISGKSKGYAFILFKHRTGTQKALKQPQKKIGNRLTSCQLASAGPVPAPPPAGPPVSEYTQRKIFISNVSTEIDPQKLMEFFRQYGEIEEGPLGLDRQTGKPKGFALFVYKTVESAKKALEEPHKNYEGHILHCQKAIDGPKHSKQFHQHQFEPHYPSRKEKNKYIPHGAGGGTQGHLMAPSGPTAGFNPQVAAQALNPALGQALTALLASQGAGLGLSSLLSGIGGAPINQAGPAGYGNPAGGSYASQSGMQGGYQNPQIGQTGGARPSGVGNMGGAPYMGH